MGQALVDQHVQSWTGGCCLPFADRPFDWVFSNAAVEHVSRNRGTAEVRGGDISSCKVRIFCDDPEQVFSD